uniref:Uncharacterized protein n=1 Tax=Anguilla anguilla TaxID=7936 RepID=A0A0E9V411_ANGAN
MQGAMGWRHSASHHSAYSPQTFHRPSSSCDQAQVEQKPETSPAV